MHTKMKMRAKDGQKGKQELQQRHEKKKTKITIGENEN
jgi:hypothetical protein